MFGRMFIDSIEFPIFELSYGRTICPCSYHISLSCTQKYSLCSVSSSSIVAECPDRYNTRPGTDQLLWGAPISIANRSNCLSGGCSDFCVSSIHVRLHRVEISTHLKDKWSPGRLGRSVFCVADGPGDLQFGLNLSSSLLTPDRPPRKSWRFVCFLFAITIIPCFNHETGRLSSFHRKIKTAGLANYSMRHRTLEY
jgi:hypothetical protein